MLRQPTAWQRSYDTRVLEFFYCGANTEIVRFRRRQLTHDVETWLEVRGHKVGGWCVVSPLNNLDKFNNNVHLHLIQADTTD